MPILVIFQIPASSYVPRIGFKKFVYAGWGTRVSMIFLMALVPLTALFLNLGAQLSLMLFLLFGFNLSRGISSAAWLPWITTLVPAPVRGRYLAGDQACMNVASGVAFLVAAFMLWGRPEPWRFAVVFAFSAVMGAVSLQFLKRIPDVPVPKEPAGSGEPVPWLAISSHPPFYSHTLPPIFLYLPSI